MDTKNDNWPYAHYIQFSDNSLKILQPKPSANVRELSNIYPPPNNMDIVEIRFSIFIKQIIILVRSGSLYFYRMEEGTSVMTR